MEPLKQWLHINNNGSATLEQTAENDLLHEKYKDIHCRSVCIIWAVRSAPSVGYSIHKTF